MLCGDGSTRQLVLLLLLVSLRGLLAVLVGPRRVGSFSGLEEDSISTGVAGSIATLLPPEPDCIAVLFEPMGAVETLLGPAVRALKRDLIRWESVLRFFIARKSALLLTAPAFNRKSFTLPRRADLPPFHSMML
jgi:hypothetical protein